MSNTKHKILVLSDLNEHTGQTLINAFGLAKLIDGEISLFHVTKPMDVVDRESQLSAVRTINEKSSVTKRQIEHYINTVKGLNKPIVNYSYTLGNIKHEIEQHILKTRPDVIVLGKRKSKVVNLMGDNITDFILKSYKGVIFISGNENLIPSDKKVALGVFNENGSLYKSRFANGLLAQTQKPLKTFKFVKTTNKETTSETNMQPDFVEYVFEYNDNTIQNFSNYLQKNNLNLLFVDRDIKNQGLTQTDIREVIGKTNISLLISNI